MAKFTNALANETSPYLLQHAHNPVQWYPWGTEALDRAKKEDKPILVSIGYAACHWCHVMERESFENEDTARIMNEYFINIKIDREERPDLDHIYMDAVQAIAGNGGWPLNVFLTPDCKPFYGGTYFPPVRAYNRSSWVEVLQGVNNLFREKRAEVEKQAEELTAHIGKSSDFGSGISLETISEDIFSKQHVHEIYEQIMKQADKKWGGFGRAPKFPQTFTIKYLLKYHLQTGNTDALNQACLSLDKMICGGIYDHLGGGFARYSTDEEWLAPHFEKMLYDNALLLSVLADAYKLTSKDLYQRTIRETVSFIDRELTAPGGGFYAALDADSEGEEGKFYVWDKEEIQEVLGTDAALFSAYYDVSETGNWEGKNILRTLVQMEDFAASKNMHPDDFELLLQQCRQKLLERRERRVRPQLDDKIILGWNALLITALCQCATALGDESLREKAIYNFEFIWNAFSEDGSNIFLHTFKNGKAKYPAFLDDYAYLIEAAINLHQLTSDNSYIAKALRLTNHTLQEFFDDDAGMFFYTHKNQDDVIVRKKEIYDGATPSGNAIMAGNLAWLAAIFNNPFYQSGANKKGFREIAAGMTASLLQVIVKYPGSFGNWAQLLSTFVTGEIEVAIVGKEYDQMRDEVLKNYLPGIIIQSADSADENYPLLAGRESDGETFLYLCRNYACEAPMKDLKKTVKAIQLSLKL